MLIFTICRTWHPLQLFKTRRTNFLSTWFCAFSEFFRKYWSKQKQTNKTNSPTPQSPLILPSLFFYRWGICNPKSKKDLPKVTGQNSTWARTKRKASGLPIPPSFPYQCWFPVSFAAPASPSIWKSRKAGKLITCLFMEVRAGSRESHRAWPSSND